MKIEYIGKKPMVRDTVAGTGTVWNGPGDVQEVPDASAGALLAHSGVWAKAGAKKFTLKTEEAKKAEGGGPNPGEEGGGQQGDGDGGGDGDGQQGDATASVKDELTDMNDDELKSFARSKGLNSREAADGIRADLRKKGDELRDSIRLALLAAQEAGEEV